MSEFIIFWKDSSGQQVSTVVDAHNNPVTRDYDYLETNDITILNEDAQVLVALKHADGVKYAITRELARSTLGWDV